MHAGVGPRPHTYIYLYIHACRGGPSAICICTHRVGPRPHVHIYPHIYHIYTPPATHIHTYMHIHFMPGWCPGHTHTRTHINIYIYIYVRSCQMSPRPHMYTHVYVWHAGVGPTPHYSCITRMLGLCAPGQDAYASRTCPGCALAPGHIHTNIRVCVHIYKRCNNCPFPFRADPRDFQKQQVWG